MCARQAQRQIARLAAGIDEEADAQRFRQRGAEAFRVLRDVGVQIPRVGVEHRHLFLPGPHHARMAVPHMGHVVNRVEVFASVRVIQVLALAADDVQGAAVGEAQIRAEVLLPDGGDLRVGRPGREAACRAKRVERPPGRNPVQRVE